MSFITVKVLNFFPGPVGCLATMLDSSVMEDEVASTKHTLLVDAYIILRTRCPASRTSGYRRRLQATVLSVTNSNIIIPPSSYVFLNFKTIIPLCVW